MAATDRIAIQLPALILAGEESAHPSPLAFSERVEQKALVEVGSKPMIDWTLEAVRACPRTGQIRVVGLDSPYVVMGEDVVRLPGVGDLAGNLIAGLQAITEREGQDVRALVMGCDAPLVVPEALTWFVDACGDRSLDLYLAVVRQETLEAIYPNSERSWFKTREGRFVGSDLALVRPAALLNHQAEVRELLENRRDATALQRRLFSVLGVRVWLGMVGLRELRDALQQTTGITIGVVELPFASVALDVDTLEDLAVVRNEMAQQRMLRAA